MSNDELPWRDTKLWRDSNDPKNRHNYCLSRPDGAGGHKSHCVSCSVDEELKILKHYTFCAKKADCSTKYIDKPIWNVVSRLCEPCDPQKGCIDTGDVRFHFPQPEKKVDCRPRGIEVKGTKTCKCPTGWITDFTQNPDYFIFCNVRDWNHIYNVRRRTFESRKEREYKLVLFTSILGVILSFCFILCFLSLLRKACRKIFPLHRPKRRFKYQMLGGKPVP